MLRVVRWEGGGLYSVPRGDVATPSDVEGNIFVAPGQDLIWARIGRLQGTGVCAGPQKHCRSRPQLCREVSRARGGRAWRSGLEAFHGVPECWQEGQGVTAPIRCHELAWKSQVFPVHQLRRRVVDVLLLGGPNGQQDDGQGVDPVGGVWERTDSLLQAPVKTLHHTVGLRVICSGALARRAQES